MQEKPQVPPAGEQVETVDLRHLDRVAATMGIGCCGRPAGHVCCGRHHSAPHTTEEQPPAADTHK